MATIRSRSETVAHGEIVELKALFKDQTGTPTDLDAFPVINIIQPSGNVVYSTPTSSGVYHISTGLYGYLYQIGINSPDGVWTDVWTGLLNNFSVSGSFNFVISDLQLPHINSDGYIALGDDPGFNYSQIAILNINILMKMLRARLNSSGKAKAKDINGNDIYIDCDIFSVEELTVFLAQSLTLFNEIPTFTFFTFDDSDIIRGFADIIVQGALILALASKAILERARELQISDQSLSFTPPTVSDILNSQYSAEMSNHLDKLKMIKGSMKPVGIGLGTISIASSRNPTVSMLRFRRARQVI